MTKRRIVGGLAGAAVAAGFLGIMLAAHRWPWVSSAVLLGLFFAFFAVIGMRMADLE